MTTAVTGTTPVSIVRAVERGVRYALLAVFVVGVRRRNPGAVANAVLALAATCLPDAVERHSDVEFRPWQRAYAGVAMLAHAVGMLGPYDDVWWWDHVTHAHSATLLGGLVHLLARRRGQDPRPRVLAAVAGGGVLWELAEYAVHAAADRVGWDPPLVHYGRGDTVLDIVFDLVGAAIVLVFGDRLFGAHDRTFE